MAMKQVTMKGIKWYNKLAAQTQEDTSESKTDYSLLRESSDGSESLDAERAIPQGPKSKQSVVRNYAVLLGKVFFITLAVWGICNFGRSTASKFRKPVSCSCGGTTVAEAQRRGCVFTPLALGWLPPQCLDMELSDEFDKLGHLPGGEWPYWADLNGTTPITREEMGMLADVDGLFYTTQEWHIMHCMFTWRKHYRSQFTGVTVEKRSNGIDHIHHYQLSRVIILVSSHHVIKTGKSRGKAASDFRHNKLNNSLPLKSSSSQRLMALHDVSVKEITPPGSMNNDLPTPPLIDTKPAASVAKILQALRDYQNSAPPSSPWTAYKLDSEEYKELLVQLKHDELLGGFVPLKVRYDYDPIQSKFTLRMATVLHNTFISKLMLEIHKMLERLADEEIEAQPYIKGIEPETGVLNFPIGDGDQQQAIRHEPDMTFKHRDAAWPGVVIELAYSQKKKSLVDLADNYILGSYGGIGVVVGLDLDYKKSRKASISVWRLKISTGDDGKVKGKVEQVVDNQVTCPSTRSEGSTNIEQLFRDAEGNHLHSPSSNLKLSLKDFATEKVAHGVPDFPIIIDSKTLCKLLGEAESCYNKIMTMQGDKPEQFEREWRAQTPPEQLTP
ncbi:hypothetical protein B7494_g7348 [Chlorociboria aeruginascens]|nr:hypothetical protein B7494_g7348 [Chlorociboria aeruginascens]